MSANDIAKALGGYASASGWHRVRCPVHQSIRNSLALKDDSAGRLIVHCHAGCTREAVMSELQRIGLDFDAAGSAAVAVIDPAELARRREAEAANRRQRIANALDMWSEAVSADETIVETYLWSRLLCITPPLTLRLHRALWHSESRQRRPALIGLVEHVDYGRVGVHATWLAPDGSGKATLDPPRKFFGPVGGGAVRLGAIGDDRRLVVGEGIETVLSVMVSTGIPGWAALSAGGVERLILPHEVCSVIVAADRDENGRGQAAAEYAAARFRTEGRSVKVFLPPVPGDWNDALLCRIPASEPYHAVI
jgi:putative DNA primase/helicase